MKKFMILMALVVFPGLGLLENVNGKTPAEVINVEQTKEKESFEEIQLSKIPATIKDAVAKKYEGYKIEKAYHGDKGNYKIAVSKVGEKKLNLYYNKNGEFIKQEINT